MKTATEMRALVRENHPLNKYFEKVYTPQIEELAKEGTTSLSIEVCKIPLRMSMSKSEICEILKDYISSFGYNVSVPADNKKIHIRW